MRYNLTLLCVFSLLIMQEKSEAGGLHCLQRSYSNFGDTKVCIKNISLTREDFIQMCERHDSNLIQFNISYPSACPPNHKATCSGLKTASGDAQPYRTYFYHSDLLTLKASCINNGGQWEEKVKSSHP